MITMARPTKSETTVRSMQLRAHDSQTMHGRVPSQSSAQWYYPTKTHPLAVYLIETENTDLLPNESDETDLCCICHLRSNTVTDMIECSRCIGGFHMKCLKPALKSIPKVRLEVQGHGMRTTPGYHEVTSMCVMVGCGRAIGCAPRVSEV
jgi:hypothetical protein